MESIITFIQEVASQPRYANGWILFGILSVVPAIISGNVLLHTLTKLWRRQSALKEEAMTVLLNFAGLVLFTAIIAVAIYRHLLN